MPSIPNREVLKQRLDKLMSRGVGHLELVDQGHFSKYVCVLVSGYLEVAIQEIFAEYARHRSQPAIHGYFSQTLSSVYNCKLSRVLALSQRFGSDVHDAVQSVANDETKSALDSIVNNKNHIAHGLPDNISFQRVSNYYNRIKKFLAELERVLGLT